MTLVVILFTAEGVNLCPLHLLRSDTLNSKSSNTNFPVTPCFVQWKRLLCELIKIQELEHRHAQFLNVLIFLEREFSKTTYQYKYTTTSNFTVLIPSLPEMSIKHSPNFKLMFFHLLCKTCYCNMENMGKSFGNEAMTRTASHWDWDCAEHFCFRE